MVYVTVIVLLALVQFQYFKMPNGAEVRACGGGDQQMEDA